MVKIKEKILNEKLHFFCTVMTLCNGQRIYLPQGTVLHGVVPFWYSTRPVTSSIRFCLNTPPSHSLVQFPTMSSQSVKSEERIK